jgi:hypothetical protein
MTKLLLESRPVFTNRAHLAVKPAAPTSDSCQLASCGFLDERILRVTH